jgi:hypothetical protein
LSNNTSLSEHVGDSKNEISCSCMFG